MNNDLRAKNPSVFSDKTYSDEPIVRTASQMKSFEPPEYRAMRSIRFSSFEKGWSAEHVFYEQARFMEHFEDDYPFEGRFDSYFPTYADMSAEQLRGYFSWRTAVRRGENKPAPTSFLFVYIYELLNQIGVETPEEGFFKLNAFFKHYILSAPEIGHYAETWLRDYIAFYGLDVSLFSAYCDLDFERTLDVVRCSAEVSARELFDALVQLCGYDIRASAFYKRYPREFAFAVCTAFREYAAKYEKTHKAPFTEKLFGRVCEMPYTVFASAVFYDRTRTPDHVTELCGSHVYKFSSGRCTCRKCWGRRGKNPELGAYVKYIDAVLRETFSFGEVLASASPVKPFEKVARTAAEKAFAQARAAEEAEKRRYVDASQLDDIIVSADKTRDKLLTEEELDADTPAAADESPAEETEHGEETAAEKAQEACSLPLSPEELGFIKCLLAGENAAGYASAHGMKLSLLCDALNEKLYEVFYDTVIDFEGDTPFIIEDYADELRKMTEG